MTADWGLLTIVNALLGAARRLPSEAQISLPPDIDPEDLASLRSRGDGPTDRIAESLRALDELGV